MRIRQRTPLCDLGGCFVEFTQTRGVLRNHREYVRAQGLVFYCPKCVDGAKKHIILSLFDLKSVPPEAAPSGRWDFHGTGLSDVTLHSPVHSREGCSWVGVVNKGTVLWRG